MATITTIVIPMPVVAMPKGVSINGFEVTVKDCEVLVDPL